MNRLVTIGTMALAAAALVRAQQPASPAVATPMMVVAGQGTAGFADGTGAEARFNKPIRLAPLGPDTIVVSDIYNHAVRLVSKDGRVTTLAGAPDRKGHQDGPAATARFSSPHGVGTTADGRIAVAEAEGHTLRLMTPRREMAGGYEVTTIAGTPGKSGAQDGPAAQALFNSPHAALWGSDGALYAPDIGNRTIRRVRNGQVETVAGQDAGSFVYPMDIAWMTDGRMVVADAGSNLILTWRPGERVKTLEVRGPLATPHGVASGPDGTVFVADMKSHRILAVDANGAMRTVAGVEGEAGGDRTHLNRPAAVLVHANWLWIADLDNHRITAVDLARKR